MGLIAEFVGSCLLFLLVFGMSGTVEMKSLQKQIRNAKALCIGLAMQFVISPFIGFCVVKLFQLPAEIGIMLLVITTSPGGSYSNWWCSLFNAELALSVTMTTLSTLLSTILLPTNLVLYTRWTYSPAVVKSLDWSALMISIATVIGGIASGLLASYIASRRGRTALFRTRANRIGNVAGISLIVLSFSVSSSDEDTSLWDRGPKFYIGCAFPAILGLFMSNYLATKAELDPPERVAVAVEACYQNTGIATSVALTLYKGSELAAAIGVPLYYGIVEAVLLAIYCITCWKKGWTKAPRDENICKVLYHSYEVDDDELRQEEMAIEAEKHEGEGGATTAASASEDNDVVVTESVDGKVMLERKVSDGVDGVTPAASSSFTSRIRHAMNSAWPRYNPTSVSGSSPKQHHISNKTMELPPVEDVEANDGSVSDGAAGGRGTPVKRRRSASGNSHELL
jgi:predicted Na+-dependent transporter